MRKKLSSISFFRNGCLPFSPPLLRCCRRSSVRPPALTGSPTPGPLDIAGSMENFRNDDNQVFCESRRLAVETNNAGVWNEIPERCVIFVKDYVIGVGYPSDCSIISNYSRSFATGIEIAGDGKDAWIFYVDDTLPSWLPYVIDFYGPVLQMILTLNFFSLLQI